MRIGAEFSPPGCGMERNLRGIFRSWVWNGAESARNFPLLGADWSGICAEFSAPGCGLERNLRGIFRTWKRNLRGILCQVGADSAPGCGLERNLRGKFRTQVRKFPRRFRSGASWVYVGLQNTFQIGPDNKG